MIEIKKYFYHFDLLSFDPLSVNRAMPIANALRFFIHAVFRFFLISITLMFKSTVARQ